MSGIGGIVRLDGAAASRASIAALADAVAHRGPDAQGAWSGGPVALVHAMLQTTPESLHEPQPFVDDELVVAADVRLDDRAQLIAQLAPPTTGDAALIAAAYRRWGADCARHLEGDFAFALWDARERTLFCARDPFGVKPLVFTHVPGKLFAFGSVARIVLALEDVPRAVDETRIAEFLSIEFGNADRTFHRELRRLRGGHTLTLREQRIELRRYWSPESVRPLGRKSDAEYAEGFREHFTRAVRERMRVAAPHAVGSMLSGGLDSSFISCVARDAASAPLPVFSWIFSDVMQADEREYQQAVLATGGFRPVTLDSQQVAESPWRDLDALLPDGPPYAPNYYLNAIAARAGRDVGVRVLLDGLGGDSTISRGAARFTELFFRGRPFTLARELRALAARRGESKSLPRLFVAHVAAPLMPAGLVQLAQRLRGRATDDARDDFVRPDVAARAEANRRRRIIITTRQEHVAQLSAPLMAEGLELFDRVLAANGAEGRYPFFDRRLVEYCLSLPGDQKLASGYNRIVARRAMEGIVPPAVQWRVGKGAPGLHIIHALRAARAELDPILLRDPAPLAPYVDVDRLRATYARLLSGGDVEFRTAIRLWSATVLGQWLARR